jgi:hypothetical protein
MDEGNTIVSSLIKVNGAHLMSSTDMHRQISEYFITDEFATLGGNKEVDANMLANISEGITNYIRKHDKLNLPQAVAVCDNAKVGIIKDTNDMAVVFSLGITTDANV